MRKMTFNEWWSAFEQVLTVRNQRMLAQTAWDFAYEMATKAEHKMFNVEKVSFDKWWTKIHHDDPVLGRYGSAKSAWEAAIKAERERCASICEEVICEISSYEADECSKEIKAKILNT